MTPQPCVVRKKGVAGSDLSERCASGHGSDPEGQRQVSLPGTLKHSTFLAGNSVKF